MFCSPPVQPGTQPSRSSSYSPPVPRNPWRKKFINFVVLTAKLNHGIHRSRIAVFKTCTTCVATRLRYYLTFLQIFFLYPYICKFPKLSTIFCVRAFNFWITVSMFVVVSGFRDPGPFMIFLYIFCTVQMGLFQ